MCALFCEFVPTAACDIVLRSNILFIPTRYSSLHVIHTSEFVPTCDIQFCEIVLTTFWLENKIRGCQSCPNNSLRSNFLLCKISLILQLKSDFSKHKKPAIITVTSRMCFFGYPQSKFVFHKSCTRIIRVNHTQSV